MTLKELVFSNNDKKAVKDFLSLPKRLYPRNELTQNKSEELALLCGTHILSRYFSVVPILVYRDSKAVSRAVVTLYPDDDTAYLGFFESKNDPAAAKLLFDTAIKISAENGKNRITGPVDCSFWIKYRLKTDCFYSPYTGEPYNKDYYPELWEKNGFTVLQKYSSNHYIVVNNDNGCEKYAQRLEEKLQGGYVIKCPSPDEFDKTLHEVYAMIIELYSDFPAYKKISEDEFCCMFSYLKSVVNYSMIKMAYFDDKPVGFYISVPNYGNDVYGKLNIPKIICILKEKKKPRSYVMLYMGVDRSHRGLGKAFAEIIRQELKKQAVPSIGALIRHGNCNQDYMEQFRDYKYGYTLYSRRTNQSLERTCC